MTVETRMSSAIFFSHPRLTERRSWARVCLLDSLAKQFRLFTCLHAFCRRRPIAVSEPHQLGKSSVNEHFSLSGLGSSHRHTSFTHARLSGIDYRTWRLLSPGNYSCSLTADRRPLRKNLLSNGVSADLQTLQRALKQSCSTWFSASF